jgi:hypothetical protein
VAVAFDVFIASHPSSPRAGEAAVMLGWMLTERNDCARASPSLRRAQNDPSARVRQSSGGQASMLGRMPLLAPNLGVLMAKTFCKMVR